MPHSVSSLVTPATRIGISGSRRPSAASLTALHSLLAIIRHRQAAHTPTALIVTGCARGVDQAVRASVPPPQLRIVTATGPQPGLLAARSTRAVRCVALAGGTGLWCAFPAGPCPPGLAPSPSPSHCFAGHGSGTWASLALALGSGLACLAWLHPGWVPSAWGLRPLLGPHHAAGWVTAPGAGQASLF